MLLVLFVVGQSGSRQQTPKTIGVSRWLSSFICSFAPTAVMTLANLTRDLDHVLDSAAVAVTCASVVDNLTCCWKCWKTVSSDFNFRLKFATNFGLFSRFDSQLWAALRDLGITVQLMSLQNYKQKQNDQLYWNHQLVWVIQLICTLFLPSLQSLTHLPMLTLWWHPDCIVMQCSIVRVCVK